MRIETVDLPGVGVINHVCDNCLVGPLFPLMYLGRNGKEYCSPKCRDEGSAMKHPEFGGADVQHPTCDHCHGPIKVVAIRGRYGRYCKQACCTAAESNLTEEEKRAIMAKKTAAKKTAKAAQGTPAKKTVAKKSQPKTPPKQTKTRTPGEMFRPGATKHDIWKELEPGKPVAMDKLKKITETASKTPQLIGFVLSRVRKEGYTVTRDKEAGTVQVTK